LDIDALELYQIDHIIPQSKIKNDSFDNKVLVKSIENQRKLDGFLDDRIIESRKEYWSKLLKSNLISQTKYFSLLNNKDSDARNEGFIKRQLVETRQITKYATNIIQQLYNDTNVCTIKAELAHDFRQKYDVFKIRELNDYHHIHDAYINAVIGMYINKRYPKMLKEFVYSDYIKEFKKQSTEEDGKKKKQYGFIVSNMGKEYTDMTTGEIIDKNTSEKQIESVLKQLKIKDAFVTRKLEEQTGEFYNQTIYSKNEKITNAIPLKKGLDPNKYGAYTSQNTAYMVLFEHILKNKKHFQIVGIPIKDITYIKNDNENLKQYIEEKFQYENVKIIKNKILKHQLIYKAGKPYDIKSSGDISIAKQLQVDENTNLMIYILLNKKVKSNTLLKAYNILDKLHENNYTIIAQNISEYVNNKNEKTTEEKKANHSNMDELLKWTKETAAIYVYDVLTNKIKSEYFENIGEKLEGYRDNMLNLIFEDKIKVIQLLLQLTSGKSIDLKIIGGKSGQGRVTMQNMNSKWLADVVFVEQSTTGMYEKRFKLDELENGDSNK
ncbi:MAG: type II CRISPR RNA-guided endonuclease Cas9, partial [Clostridia bacterium]